MANIKSAIRRVKTAQRNKERNKVYKDNIKKIVKKFKAAPSADLLKQAASALDKAALKRILHRNKTARIKSQLAKLLATKK